MPKQLLGHFDSVEVQHVPPDPGVLKAIGSGHDLESAVAELVDNSIDAGAQHVHIRFVLNDGLIRQILVIDDGKGMSSREIDSAMVLGKPKTASESALGFFGVGLKAASFSTASVLTVLTKTKDGSVAGRRLAREAGNDFEADVLRGDQVVAAFDDQYLPIKSESGTIIRWDELHAVPVSSDRTVTDNYVENKVASLRSRLGLVFHRLIRDRTVHIGIDVFDVDKKHAGFTFSVEAIDPFGYVRSGAAGYPKTLYAQFGGKTIALVCHIWPAGSDSHQFKLQGGLAEKYQGFYIYRNGRLLSVGQWNGLVHETRQLRLARVSIDIEDNLEAFVMTTEKSGVRMRPDLAQAVEKAKSEDGIGFFDYLQVAEETYKQNNKRTRRRAAILKPGKGLAPRVKRTIEKELDLLPGEEPLAIRWKKFYTDDFFEVDRSNRTLWLNAAYRTAVLNGRGGGANDAPLLKTVLFLLFEEVFRGTSFGPRDKDNVNLWREILSAAADAERRGFDA